jgi:hypothetical protein
MKWPLGLECTQQDAFSANAVSSASGGIPGAVSAGRLANCLLQDQAVGQLVVERTGEAILLIDIALLPQYRTLVSAQA